MKNVRLFSAESFTARSWRAFAQNFGRICATSCKGLAMPISETLELALEWALGQKAANNGHLAVNRGASWLCSACHSSTSPSFLTLMQRLPYLRTLSVGFHRPRALTPSRSSLFVIHVCARPRVADTITAVRLLRSQCPLDFAFVTPPSLDNKLWTGLFARLAVSGHVAVVQLNDDRHIEGMVFQQPHLSLRRTRSFHRERHVLRFHVYSRGQV